MGEDELGWHWEKLGWHDACQEALEKLSIFVPVDGDDKYSEGYRDGLAKAREILGGMLVE